MHMLELLGVFPVALSLQTHRRLQHAIRAERNLGPFYLDTASANNPL